MKRIFFLIVTCMMSNIAFSQEGRIASKGLAVDSPEGAFHTHEFTRHAVGDDDVLVEILYSGICHSDLHQVHGDWMPGSYPMVPGHEIAGRVAAVGKNVTKFKVGDLAGVGCMVNSCGECEHCKGGEEMFCDEHKTVYTYNSHDVFHGGEITMGGYSNNIVVDEHFAVKIPEGADLKRVAPLLCAGITTYSPIMFSHVEKGDKVGVAGFGGLGHMAVQYAVSLGADVTVFDVTEEKREDALRMGAVRYVNVNSPEELKGLNNTMDFIISTIPARYEPLMYVSMLKKDGELAIVGLPANSECPSISIGVLPYMANRKIYGSLIGGMKETQEMVDYSVAHNIYPEVEVIPAEGTAIDEAYRKVAGGEVKFRYVIDMSTLK